MTLLMMPPIAAWTRIFLPLPSSLRSWARRYASSPKTAASSCCSSIVFLSKNKSYLERIKYNS
ncbi:hypothetical protein HMPREF9555_01533 [Selenomonas artemidis F0399]|uniref:Uncharacterized protein n=1 Tax=Selenomonas artemidis F0399 TaxID=749551 RepID=E7N3F6_9FIRM|nr:hypothetical protein HMPREF9555_01533 [Selenomonas artemidis F0399]